MTQKEPTTLLGRCTTVANRDSHYKGYDRHQAANKSANTGTNKTTINSTTLHLNSKCHMIHYPSKQQKLNEVMDALQKANNDVNILFKFRDVLSQHLKYH